MNYRHHYHAGNFADLLKHALLIDLIRRLRQRGGAIRVLDTHAGAGLYDLSGEMAQKSKEASGGILALDAAGDPPALLGALLALVRDSNAGPTLRYYPGSPRIALAKLTKGDLYVGCELRPDDSDALKKASQGSIGVGRQTVYGDGYAAARAIGPFAGETLVLIDPPYEQGDDYDQVVETCAALLKRSPKAVIAIWAPIKDLETFDALLRRLEELPASSGYVLSTRLKSLANPMRLNGSAMIVLNAGSATPDEQAAAEWIVAKLGEPGGRAETYSLFV